MQHVWSRSDTRCRKRIGRQIGGRTLIYLEHHCTVLSESSDIPGRKVFGTVRVVRSVTRHDPDAQISDHASSPGTPSVRTRATGTEGGGSNTLYLVCLGMPLAAYFPCETRRMRPSVFAISTTATPPLLNSLGRCPETIQTSFRSFNRADKGFSELIFSSP